jgi:hypothetical protein
MATSPYQVNITKNLDAAVASTAPLQQAAQAQGEAARVMAQSRTSAAQAITKAAGVGFELYKEYDIASTTDKDGLTADQLAYEALERTELANVAADQLPSVLKEQNRIQTALAAQRTIFEEGGVDFNALEQSAYKKSQATGVDVLAGYADEVSRLKQASMGGMSPDEYVSRVSSITRKAIAKYPGEAEKIRSDISKITGLPGADRFAELSNVKRMFSEKQAAKGPTEDEMVVANIKRIAPLGTFGNEGTLFKTYKENPQKYYKLAAQADDVLATQTALKQAKDELEAGGIKAEFEAAMFRKVNRDVGNAVLGSSLINFFNTRENEFLKVASSLQAGTTNLPPAEFAKQVELYNADVAYAYNRAKADRLANLQEFRDKNRLMTDKTYREYVAEIELDTKQGIERFSGKDALTATALVHKNYAEASSKEKMARVQHIVSIMGVGPKEFIQSYYSGGSARTNLERSQPDFFKWISDLDEQFKNSMVGDTAASNAIAIRTADMKQRFNTAAGNPAAQVTPTIPNETKADTKAWNNALWGEGMAKLDEVISNAKTTGKIDPIEQNVLNVMSSAISTAGAVGGQSNLLQANYKTIGLKVNELPDDAQAVIKSNASDGVVYAVDNIVKVKQFIEDKYKVKLEVGTNDAGELSVVLPQPTPPPVRGGSPITNNTRAAQEFMNYTKPLLTNIVYTRAMLTQEDSKVVAREFASTLTSNSIYTGFYSKEAKSVVLTSTMSDAARLNVPATNVGASVSGKVTPVTPAVTKTKAADAIDSETTPTKATPTTSSSTPTGNDILNSLRELK